MDTLSEPALVSRFPSVPNSEDMAMEVHSLPTLLRKDLGPMFPENPNMSSVITLSFCTENDTSKSGWLSSEIGDFAPRLSGDISDLLPTS